MNNELVFPPVRVGETVWDWTKTYIFGVVNVTPDSFSDGGRFLSCAAAVDHAQRLIESGADALDIGGESTRPGATPVPVDEELRRVMPVIEKLAGMNCPVPISIDTYKSTVAAEAIAAGAAIVNDVSGTLMDEKMPAVVASSDALLILGHLRGTAQTMQQHIDFKDVVSEVIRELRGAIRRCVHAGVRAEQLWFDPGLGFGKTTPQSYALMRNTAVLRKALGYPILVGPSRKSFIGQITQTPVDQREAGTAAAVAALIALGADAVRIHDVAQLKSAVQVADAVRRGLSS